MTDAATQHVRHATPHKTARAFVLALGALAAVAMAAGAALPFDQSVAVFAGLALAAASVLLASLFSRRIMQRSDAKSSPLLDGQRMQALLGAGFVLKLFVLLGAFLAMDFAGLKFSLLLAFALAFAGAALVLQIVVAIQLARTPRMDLRVSTDVQR